MHGTKKCLDHKRQLSNIFWKSRDVVEGSHALKKYNKLFFSYGKL